MTRNPSGSKGLTMVKRMKCDLVYSSLPFAHRRRSGSLSRLPPCWLPVCCCWSWCKRSRHSLI